MNLDLPSPRSTSYQSLTTRPLSSHQEEGRSLREDIRLLNRKGKSQYLLMVQTRTGWLILCRTENSNDTLHPKEGSGEPAHTDVYKAPSDPQIQSIRTTVHFDFEPTSQINNPGTDSSSE